MPLFDNIVETTLSECYTNPTYRKVFWTAGQRIDPSRRSTFVWRVTSTNTYSDTVSRMTYTNWYTGEPNGGGNVCMHLWGDRSYKWNDHLCNSALCSVCEIDIQQ